MPQAPKKPCNHPGCGVLVRRVAFCDKHKQYTKTNNAHKKNLYDRWWRRERLIFLSLNPLCVDCLAEGRTTAAVIVDHIKPHRGNIILFRNKSNWQPLCKYHHDYKTVTEDGGMGNY